MEQQKKNSEQPAKTAPKKRVKTSDKVVRTFANGKGKVEFN